MKTCFFFCLSRRLVAGVCGFFCALAHAGTVQVAVAANFSVPMQKIAAAFEKDTGHQAVLSFGATGKFYAQIRNGAPFAVLLAADDETPARLLRDGLAVPGSTFTYATGQLALWSHRPGLVDDQGKVLQATLPGKLAVADPRLAPYGAAALQTLDKLGVLEKVRSQFVVGESVGQTFQFVKTGNAALGFVALSQIMAGGRITSGSAWVVPAQLHEPIRQDAALLRPGQDNAAARALLQYLRQDVARQIIRAHGYLL